MTRRVHFVHENAKNKIKHKLEPAAMENIAEKAAALVSLAHEFRANHPVEFAVVQEKVLQEWSHGCDRIDMELTAALLEKSDDFAPGSHMPCFKSLLEDSLFKAPVSSNQEARLICLFNVCCLSVEKMTTD